MDDAINLKGKLLAEQVQEQIFQYILKTPVALGDRLPNEFELGEKFGVGRSTVREAVKLLVSRGILEVRRGTDTPNNCGKGVWDAFFDFPHPLFCDVGRAEDNAEGF